MVMLHSVTSPDSAYECESWVQRWYFESDVA